ncbi:MAG: rhodanese-related sulfurtransferase [Chthonomonas sp.]|nr:rhodanese-related sulfurtransferase [Chthonomonas sp.]
MAFQVLLYYWFTEVADPEGFARRHRELCEKLNLRGRILIAPEGINGTVSGLVADCEAYQTALRAEPGFGDMEFKVDPAEGHAFKAMHVRVRPEIITLGADASGPTALHLDAETWRDMMAREDAVILDGRNAYESELGHFANAICPPIQNFRELPEWLQAHRDEFAGKQILTYCTGGIRCEKLTAWMLANGFENVFQLDGGIVKYGQDPATAGEGFVGVNVVFDERVQVSAGERSQPLTACRQCGAASANYVNCANVECNLRMILCPECEESTGRCCSEACRAAPRQRLKGKKWHESPRRLHDQAR